MTADPIRETLFVSLAEVLARKPAPSPFGGTPSYPLFTLPPGTVVNGYSAENGLIEIDATFPAPEGPTMTTARASRP